MESILNLLDKMSGNSSEYEFNYLIMEQTHSFHRQLKIALTEKERCESLIQEYNAEIELMNYNLSKDLAMLPSEIQEIKTKINSAKITRLRRLIKQLEVDVTYINNWIGSYSESEITDAIEKFETYEPEYWTHTLGKIGALELLADGKISVDTMTKITLLPDQDYTKAIQLVSKYAEFIKNSTESAETQLLNTKPQSNKKGPMIPSSDYINPTA